MLPFVESKRNIARRRFAAPGGAYAPLAGTGAIRPPALLGVDLADHEEVQWIWTHTADGQSMATGYRIVPRLPIGLRPPQEASHG